MKVVIYAQQQKGTFRINSLKRFPRVLHFAHIGIHHKSIEPKKIYFMTRPISETAVPMTEDVAERTIAFFKENFEEFNHPFIAIFEVECYPKTLEEFSCSGQLFLDTF